MRREFGRCVPILIITDCEPDARQPGGAPPWAGFERFFEFLSARRPTLAARTRAAARFSWFWRLDPQIEHAYGSAGWPAHVYAGQIAEAEREGDEMGLHTHAWRWDPGLGTEIADHGNPAWIETCLGMSFDEYRSTFGRDCEIFRFGDGWLDEATVVWLERRGVKIDLTIEPGLRGRPSLVPEEASTGSIPDRRAVPRRPYHPSRADFRRPDRADDIRLWIFPVSTGPATDEAPLTGSGRSLGGGLWSRVAAPEQPQVQLNLGIEPSRFMPIFHRAVTARHRPYAAICVRTDVGSHAGLMSCVERNLQGVLDHPLAGAFVFMTPSDALTVLTDE